MKLRIVYIILLAFLGWVPVKAQSGLDPFLEEAGKNNPQLLARFNEYLAALEKLPQVKSLPDPQLAMAYFIQPVETRMGPQRFKLSVSQFFPWFGSLDAAGTLAAEEAKSKLEVFEETKSRLFHEIRSSYYSLFLTSKAIEISSDNQKILESFKRLALIKIESGKGSSLDDIRLDIELGDLENQLALLDDQIQAQWIAFDKLVNTPDAGRPVLPTELENVDLSISKTVIRESIFQKNHILLKLDLESSALLARKEIANLSGKPNFTVGLDYIMVGKGENNLSGRDAFVFPRIGINIPVYRDKYKARVQEIVYREVAKNHEKTDQKNVLDNLLESVWKDYRDAERRIILYERQTGLTENAIEILVIDFAANRAPFEEILRMERKLLAYSLQVEKARTDKLVAISFIKYLMGK
ncbi:MAG: TolC family protein [Bacteroidetes bacterium]|nr:TolC family protein [Bacteroidota bacterium]MBT4398374.1 TolC family protein [Bacteroidota bacterium]MBT4411350.1 TolC family protein [Bacteroidota bacterium]MBT5427840.1 TolC family protein [Bacteroidota bacterium]MBT7091616.1 TolC family protein [Bacteroidota bacterium]